MSSRLHIRTIRMSNGERRAMLCERATGFPLAKPTYYITSEVYLPGDEYNTQVSVLAAIHFLYIWAERNEIELERSFAQGKFLDLQQIDSLTKAARLDLRHYFANLSDSISVAQSTPKLSDSEYRRHKPRKIAKEPAFNTDGTTTIRLAYVKCYLDWLANGYISRTSARDPVYAAMRQAKEAMIEAIAARSPGKGNSQLRRGLKREERARFLEVIDPEYTGNPFKSSFTKHRNHLICQLLFNLGSRRGEVLLIKKGDIDWNLGGAGTTVGLQDHPTDPTDTRTVRPQFKTRERRLPLSRNLARLLKNYISKYRDRIPEARSHDYLFVARDGKPLSLSSLDAIFKQLCKMDGLPDDLTPHLLRYTWNDMFSEHADQKIASGKWTVEDEKKSRRYHQGWTDDSLMPELYSRRHIEEKARALSLEMQESSLEDLPIVDPAWLS